MAMIIPPGGFAGFSQMTPASRIALTRGTGGGGGARGGARRRRRKGAAKRTRAAGGRKRAARAGGRKMKFGSPAWQKKYRVGKFAKKKRG